MLFVVVLAYRLILHDLHGAPADYCDKSACAGQTWNYLTQDISSVVAFASFPQTASITVPLAPSWGNRRRGMVRARSVSFHPHYFPPYCRISSFYSG